MRSYLMVGHEESQIEPDGISAGDLELKHSG